MQMQTWIKPEIVAWLRVRWPFAFANGDQRRPLFLTAYAYMYAAFVGVLAAGHQAT